MKVRSEKLLHSISCSAIRIRLRNLLLNKGNSTKAKSTSRSSLKPVSVETEGGPKENIQNQQTDASNTHPVCKPNIPAININLQIHISSDASSEQIDKIFESMSKHIYNDR